MLFHQGRPVRFDGPWDAQARGISTVYQDADLVGPMSVAANLFLGREPRNRLGLVSFRRMHAAATRLLDGLGIEVDSRRELRTLTPNARRMVAIARAVSTDSRVLVLDEPAAALEPPEVDTLFDVIHRLHARDVAVVYVGHRMAELFQICNAVTVLRDGEVVHTGLMADLPPIGLMDAIQGATTQDDNVVAPGIALIPDVTEDLLPHLSVRENIVSAVAPRLARTCLLSRSRQNAVVRAFVRHLRIRVSGGPVRELSGSDQQKVMLARWIATSPKVFAPDEQIRELLAELARLGMTITATDLGDVVDGARRVVVVHAGVRTAELTGSDATADAVLSALRRPGKP
jgi:ABC-type sugar transport system ATPase subunit